MTCPQTQRELKALQDREMSSLQAWRVQRHLRACADCRREMDALERVGELVKTLEVSAINGLVQEFQRPSPALREKTLDRFRAERSEAMSKPVSKPERPAQRRFRPRWQHLGVAASLLVVWGLAYPFLTARKSQSPGMESMSGDQMKAAGGMMPAGIPGGSTRSIEQAPSSALAPPSAGSAAAVGRASRKVIQTASITLEVARFQEAYD